MAAAVFSLALVTYNASLYTNLTAATGGNSFDVGYTGADFLWTLNSFPAGAQKRQGDEQLTVSVFKTGADPDPTSGLSTDAARSLTIDALDNAGGDAAVGPNTGCMAVTTASNQVGCGLLFAPIVSDQELRTFLWLGRIRNGTYEVTATMASGEVAPQTVVLPIGAVAGTHMNAWWQCQWRTVEPTTVELRLTRTAVGPSAIGTINNQASLLLVPTPAAKPRGMRLGRRHS